MKSSIFYTKDSFYFEISFPFIAVFTVMFIFDSGYNVFMSIAAIILHESAHIMALLLFGEKIKSIHLSICELNISVCDAALSRPQKLLVALSGPMANLIIAAVFYSSLREFAYVNLALGFFQMLPIATLDGDNALNAFWQKNRFRKILSLFFAFFISFLGFLILIESKYNFSVLAISLYLIFLTITEGCNKS